MYSLFLRNVKGFNYSVQKDSYTDRCFRPIRILGNIEEFNIQKEHNTTIYQNAKMIINQMNDLRHTKKYHRAGVFLRELEGEGIIFDDEPIRVIVDEKVMTEQISLLWQCMFFNYVYD